MTHTNEQNGRQQTQFCNNNSRQRHQWIRMNSLSSSEKPSRICRDFVWGICTKNSQCKFRHVLDVESMKSIVVFCNDFQNRIGCKRPDCSYIHATREEKELFLSAGQIPRALLERHATISTVQSAAPAPMGFVPGQFAKMQAPPPPPPPPEAAPAPLPPMHAPAPLPTAALPATLAPPPPPPLPTIAATAPRMAGLMYSVPPPQNNSTAVGFIQAQPPHVIKFDTSKPPPPLPQNQSSALKRSANDTSDAGPSKMKKAEATKDVDILCENCVQREIRIEIYRQEMQKMLCEEEYQNHVYKKKLEEYETGREMLKSAIGPQLFQVIDHYFENSAQEIQGADIPQCSQTLTSPLPASSILNNNSDLHSIMAAAQKTNETNSASTDMFQGILEVLRNRNMLQQNKFPSVTSRSYQSGGGPAPPTPSTVQVPAATPTYMPYQPAVPPPMNGQYQSFNAACTNVPNIPQARMATPPVAALPSTAACTPAAPVHAQNGVSYSQQYSAWRYASQPPFYPPQ